MTSKKSGINLQSGREKDCAQASAARRHLCDRDSCDLETRLLGGKPTQTSGLDSRGGRPVRSLNEWQLLECRTAQANVRNVGALLRRIIARQNGGFRRKPTFAYSTDCLIDLDHVVIVNIEATTSIRQSEWRKVRKAAVIIKHA
jgi:hypothetical protein